MKRKIVLCLTAVFLSLPVAKAGTKEELMRLQSDVHAMQAQVRELEKSFNERTDGLRSLVEQLNDQVAKSNVALERIARSLESQVSNARSNDQALIQEIRTLSGKMDDAGVRISALAQQLSDLKMQARPMTQTEVPGGLSPDALYNQANSDLIQENFDLAIQGFKEYMTKYPDAPNVAAAQYNIGEAYYNQNMLPQAMAAFTRIINEYPESDRVASALFKRAKAELAMQETDNAITDFRDIVARFPTVPEADLAKAELRKLGASTTKPKETRRKAR